MLPEGRGSVRAEAEMSPWRIGKPELARPQLPIKSQRKPNWPRHLKKGMAELGRACAKVSRYAHIGLAGGGGDKPVVVIDLNEDAHLVGGVAVTHKGAQTRHRILRKVGTRHTKQTLAKVAPAF